MLRTIYLDMDCFMLKKPSYTNLPHQRTEILRYHGNKLTAECFYK